MQKKSLIILLILLFNNILVLGFINAIVLKDVSPSVEQFVTIISVLFVIIKFKYFENLSKVWLVIIMLLVLSLIIQSVIQYNTIFIYPHVFSKILLLFFVFITYYFSSKGEFISLRFISNTILFFYFFDLFVLGWVRYFSPFNLFTVSEIYGGAGDSRVFHAKLVYALILPLLFYLNQYFNKRNIKNLLLFLLILFIIFIQNHRTVWVTTIYALLLDYYLLIKNVSLKKSFSLVSAGVFISTILGISVIVILSFYPSLTNELIYRATDIFQFENQGTGQWRYLQVLSYLPHILNNLLFGMRFSGFEIDSSFGFAAATGQHFHNGYMEILFYFGITGILLTYGLIVIIFIRFLKSRKYEADNIVFATFILSALIFSFGYRLPFYYWGLLGMFWGKIQISNC